MTTVNAYSCEHWQNGVHSPTCVVCLLRDARNKKLSVRHYGKTFIDELDETAVIDTGATA